MSNHLSASNPDLSTAGLIIDDKPNDFPEHVVKVFRADQSFKYLLIHKVRIIGLLDVSNCPLHYENVPVQYTENLFRCKNGKFSIETL